MSVKALPVAVPPRYSIGGYARSVFAAAVPGVYLWIVPGKFALAGSEASGTTIVSDPKLYRIMR